MKKRIQKVLLGQKGHRKSQVINQLRSIFRDGHITVSIPEAKQVVRAVDRMVARLKDRDLVSSIRYLQGNLGSVALSKEIYEFSKIVASKRTSGYTTSVHAGYRKGDHTPVIRVVLTDFVKKTTPVKGNVAPKTVKSSEAKPTAAKTLTPKPQSIKSQAKKPQVEVKPKVTKKQPKNA